MAVAVAHHTLRLAKRFHLLGLAFLEQGLKDTANQQFNMSAALFTLFRRRMNDNQ